MIHVNGIHAANAGTAEDGHNYWDDWERMLDIAGPNGSVTMLSTCLDKYPQIRARYPGIRINLRFYHPNWTELEPRSWAGSNLIQILQSQPVIFDDPGVSIFGANEQDLAVEGHPEAASNAHPNVSIALFDAIFTWQLAYVDACQNWKSASSAKFLVGCLALAGGHEPAGYPPDYEFSLPSCKKVVDRADEIWAHAYVRSDSWGCLPEEDGYWFALRPLRPAVYRETVQGFPPVGGIADPGGVFVQYPAKPRTLKESGNGRHSDPASNVRTIEQMRYLYRRYADAGCRGVTWFLWDSGGEHGWARFRGNNELIQALIDMERTEVADIMTDDPRIQQLLDQNELITRALIAIREGHWTGANGVDGMIVALNGGKLPYDYKPVFPKV